jgi:NitT/TauT family transport system substrate-binding protein
MSPNIDCHLRAPDLLFARAWFLLRLKHDNQPAEIRHAGTPAAKRISAMNAWRAARPAYAGLLLAATLAGAATAAEINLRFSLDRKFEGPAAPYLLPLDKGYYKAEGLNVSIDPVGDPLNPLKRVASGDYEMGVTDINELIKFRDANPKAAVKAVFMVYNRPPFAVIGRKSRGISVPKDLESRKLGAPAGDAAFAMWPIFVKANGIDAAKVTIENIGAQVREPMLAAGQVDAITGLSFSSFLDLKDKGVPVNDIVLLLMADYGVNLYGNAIIVNAKFAAENPEAVKGFLHAFVRGLKMTVASPASALGYVLERSDTARKNLELERLKMVIRENILTPEVKANGYGGIDEARFSAAIDQLALAYKFKAAKPKPDEIFDASFLPPAAERKAH